MSAARAYKDLIEGLDAAADELRERDRTRAALLDQQLEGLRRAMGEAVERAALSRALVTLHWEAALEALWTESWLTLRPLPSPPPASGDLDALDGVVAARAADLLAAARRRFGLPGR